MKDPLKRYSSLSISSRDLDMLREIWFLESQRDKRMKIKEWEQCFMVNGKKYFFMKEEVSKLKEEVSAIKRKMDSPILKLLVKLKDKEE